MNRFIPLLLERFYPRVKIALRHDPAVASYTFGVANTPDNAFGGALGTGPTPLFNFLANHDFISPVVHRANAYQCPESKRGLDYAIFTFDEYYDPSITQTVLDEQCAFLVVTRNFHTGASNDSPIIIVPPANFAVTSAPGLTVSGTAPMITYNAGEPTPLTGCVNLHMPLHTKTVNIQNLSVNAGEVLYVSFAPGMPMAIVPPGGSMNLTGAAVPEVFLAGGTADVPYSAVFMIATTKGF